MRRRCECVRLFTSAGPLDIAQLTLPIEDRDSVSRFRLRDCGTFGAGSRPCDRRVSGLSPVLSSAFAAQFCQSRRL